MNKKIFFIFHKIYDKSGSGGKTDVLWKKLINILYLLVYNLKVILVVHTAHTVKNSKNNKKY